MDLNPGEFECEECKGTGYDLKTPMEGYNKHYYRKHYTCKKCLGVGKLDWIENVVGKKPINPCHFTGADYLPPSNHPPLNPMTGQAYVNTNNSLTYIYDGNTWCQVAPIATTL